MKKFLLFVLLSLPCAFCMAHTYPCSCKDNVGSHVTFTEMGFGVAMAEFQEYLDFGFQKETPEQRSTPEYQDQYEKLIETIVPGYLYKVQSGKYVYIWNGDTCTYEEEAEPYVGPDGEVYYMDGEASTVPYMDGLEQYIGYDLVYCGKVYLTDEQAKILLGMYSEAKAKRDQRFK